MFSLNQTFLITTNFEAMQNHFKSDQTTFHIQNCVLNWSPCVCSKRAAGLNLFLAWPERWCMVNWMAITHLKIESSPIASISFSSRIFWMPLLFLSCIFTKLTGQRHGVYSGNVPLLCSTSAIWSLSPPSFGRKNPFFAVFLGKRGCHKLHFV